MTTLLNFPMVSQLTSITSDGQPSENAQFDCVPASIGSCILWYQGKSQWDKDINPDRLKDAAYGEALHNSGTAAIAYIPFCKSQGFDLYPMQGKTPSDLVSLAHKTLQENKPAIFTEPSPYASASLGWSHVCVFYAEGPGYLVAMDPFIAKSIRRTDQEWSQLLLFQQIWIVSPLEQTINMEEPMLDLTTPGVSNFFEVVPSNAEQWHCKQTDKIIQYGILKFYRQNNGLALFGLPVSNEIPTPPGNGIVKQYFERAVLCYDPGHKIDDPPSAGDVYPLHLYDGGPGEDPMIAELKQQLAQAQQATQTSASLSVVQQIKTLVQPF